MPVEDVTNKSDGKFPILIEENYTLNEEESKFEVLETEEEETPKVNLKRRQVHLYVLVHGMGGSAGDMRLLMNEITLLNPNCEFLLSQANTGKKTMEDIDVLGRRLAEEVDSFITEYHEENSD